MGYAVALLRYAVATGIFWYVSWRHWPARVFAISGELPGFQRQLRLLATAMLLLLAVAFLVVLAVTVDRR
jgi:hypothetical protein